MELTSGSQALSDSSIGQPEACLILIMQSYYVLMDHAGFSPPTLRVILGSENLACEMTLSAARNQGILMLKWN